VNKLAYAFCAIAAWLTPACIAGLLGWSGIWGAGSAFTDFLIPIPVAGGALHVPSFLALLFAMRAHGILQPRAAALLRAVLVGTAGIGAAALLDLEALHARLTTDLVQYSLPTSDNPLGLFLLTDALWGLAWTVRTPAWRTAALPAIGIACALPAAYVAWTLASNPRVDAPFLPGRSVPTEVRGDETTYVFTRLATDAPTFRAQVLEYVAHYRPESDVNVSDLAVFFTDSLGTAHTGDGAPVLVTLCLYEDGTSERWLPGRGDCFTTHESFDDRLRAAFDALPPGTPRDIGEFLIDDGLCAGYVRTPELQDGLARAYRCHRFERAARLEELARRHPPEVLARYVTSAP